MKDMKLKELLEVTNHAKTKITELEHRITAGCQLNEQDAYELEVQNSTANLCYHLMSKIHSKDIRNVARS